jgi:phage tail sheath protein FI
MVTTTYFSPGVKVEEVPSSSAPIAGVGTSTAGFIGVIEDVEEPYDLGDDNQSVAAEEVKLVTNFGEFKKFFGDFSVLGGENNGHNTLAHAVYSFFNNGGTRCYVAWVSAATEIVNVLEESFEAIDEIAIVAAPGITDDTESALTAIKDHCENMGDRFAILDSPLEANPSNTGADDLKPFDSDYAALYYPWIQVYDPASQANKFVPPSGHMAGIYARVDTQRGVHKAPANEQIFGALDLKWKISKAYQDGLNPQGINCIRNLNGNILVWGARTLGGDYNGEWKYINVRRLFLYLRESIDEGTQWAVFEPNSPELWAKIRRNVTAFLTNVWRSGALFGTTPEQAFFVKCDEETNPPEVRDQGQVVTEIGVAVVKPAEFVIYRIGQWTGAGTN